MRIFLFIWLTIILAACSSSRPEVDTKVAISCENPYICAETTAGLSMEKAIQFPEIINEIDGVRAEYAWIKKNLPNYHKKSQAALNKNGKIYDLLIVVSSDGRERPVYFDITNFFGKI